MKLYVAVVALFFALRAGAFLVRYRREATGIGAVASFLVGLIMLGMAVWGLVVLMDAG